MKTTKFLRKITYSSVEEANGTRSYESHCVLSPNESSNENINFQNPSQQDSNILENNVNIKNTFMKDHQEALIEKDHWVPDHKARSCYHCDKEFSFFNRRHHCRVCGNVFCGACTTLKQINQSEQKLRLCFKCEKEIQNYNSLLNKNNLIQSNQNNLHQKMTQKSEFSDDVEESVDNVPDLIPTESIKIQKNLSQNKNPPIQILSLSRKDSQQQKDEEDEKQLEFFVKQSQELKQEEEVNHKKLEYYLNQMQQKDDQEEEVQSIRKESIDLDKRVNQQKLKELRQQHITDIVRDVIRTKGIDEEKWRNKLQHFVENAVTSVLPSSQLLGDQMNFNSFIKIKIINWTDNSKSTYINGVVMSNNTADKRMPEHIQNPQILLLSDSLGYLKNDCTFQNISNVIDQEEYYEQILLQKLNKVKPNIIIVQNEVSRKVLDILHELSNEQNKIADQVEISKSDDYSITQQQQPTKQKTATTNQKITVICNINSQDKMKRIARYTQTIICPSTNVINQKFQLGNCKTFRVEKPYVSTQKKSTDRPTNDQVSSKPSPTKFISKEKNLIYFEGCNPALGCTILLSGNVYEELDELKKVKSALREMLVLARNVILEKSFLYQIQCLVPKNINETNYNTLSPFLITRKFENRSTLVLNKVYIKKGAASIPIQADKIYNAPTNQQQTANNHLNVPEIDKSQLLFQNQKLDESQPLIPINPAFSNKTNVMQQPKNLNENYVKTKIDSMCSCPKKEKITFYQDNGDDNDKTFGKFLKKLCRKAPNPCEHCKEPMFKHLIQYYHRDGYIEISIELYNSTDKQNKMSQQNLKHALKNINNTADIIMQADCNICKKQIIQDQVMTSLLYEYSTGRIFEQYFYNGNKLLNFACNHRALRDTTRRFIIHNAIVVSFQFYQVDVYTIDMLRPSNMDTSCMIQQFIKEQKQKLEQSIRMAQEDLKKKLTTIRSQIDKKEKEYIIDDQTIQFFCGHLRQIKEKLNSAEDQIKELVSSAVNNILEMDTIFQGLFIERKLLINFLTLSKAIDEILMIGCLILTILKKRMEVLKYFDVNNDHILEMLAKKEGVAQSMRQSFNNNINSTLTKERQNTHIENNNYKQLQYSIDQNQTLQQMSKKNSIKNTNIIQITNNDPNESFNRAIQMELDKTFNQQMPLNKLIEDLFLGQQQQHKLFSVINTPVLQSGKLITQQSPILSYDLQTIKNLLKEEVKKLYAEIQHSIQAEQVFVIQGDYKLTLINSFHTREEEKIENIIFDSRQPSFKKDEEQNISEESIPKPIDNVEEYFNNEIQLTSLNWVSSLQNGLVTLPLGTDSIYIPVKEDDIGSIIAFVLASNKYKEALILQNYMDVASKIKGLGKHIRQAMGQPSGINLNQTNPLSTDPTPTPMNNAFGPSGAAFAQQVAFYNNQQDEHIKLLGKNDVLNSEFSPQEIETEMLCGERLIFVFQFSTQKPDINLIVNKNGVVTNPKGALTFQTGIAPRRISGLPVYLANKRKNKKAEIYDLQYKVLPNVPKEFLEHKFFTDTVKDLDDILAAINHYYFDNNANFCRSISPNKLIFDDHEQLQEHKDESNCDIINDTINHTLTPNIQVRESTMRKSQQFLSLPQNREKQTFCGIPSPSMLSKTKNSNDALGLELKIPQIDFELKMYFPKKFEALRRFYCGPQQSFIQSLLQTIQWTDVSGGKTKSKFYKTFDDKYVFKEVKKSEFKMFIEFQSQYFDYLCSSFFHNYPCTLCKILGAYKIKITHYQPQKTMIKKYIYVQENLNFGIKQEDEEHIIRYDLKGSSLNRFVQNKDPHVVLHDNNFLWNNQSRPLPLRYQMNRILHICINNDTLCLSKSNIVDYSLLTIIDKKRKKVRFGIIDYVQQYTLDKIFESKFKNFMSGEAPTIIDPEKYKLRFKRAMKKYFVGMSIQTEKTAEKSKHLPANQITEEDDSEEDEDTINETKDKIERIELICINQSALVKETSIEKTNDKILIHEDYSM